MESSDEDQDKSIEAIEASNLRDKFMMVHSLLMEYRHSNMHDICPDMFLADCWSDDLYAVYVVILLTALDSESFYCYFRPILASPAAAAHISNIISVCDSLFKSIIGCVIRAIEQSGRNIASTSSCTNFLSTGAVNTGHTDIHSKIMPNSPPLLKLYSSILIQVAQDCVMTINNINCPSIILDLLTAKQLLPSVCIDICRRFKSNLYEYLNDQIPFSHRWSSRDSGDGGTMSPLEVSKLWLFRQVDTRLLRSLLQDILTDMAKLLDGIEYVSDMDNPICSDSDQWLSLRRIGRVCCALLSVLHYSQNDLSGNSSSTISPMTPVINAELEKYLVCITEQVLRVVRLSVAAAGGLGGSSNSPTTCHASFVALCVRVFVPIILTAMLSFRYLSHQSSAISSDSTVLTSQLIKLLSLSSIPHPKQRDSSSSLHHTHPELMTYCYFMKCAFSLNRINTVREAVSREMDLVNVVEFIPQGCYVFLAQTVSAASISSSTLTGGNSEGQMQSRIVLIERNRENLLNEVKHYLIK